jgi:hypothetical protein
MLKADGVQYSFDIVYHPGSNDDIPPQRNLGEANSNRDNTVHLASDEESSEDEIHSGRARRPRPTHGWRQSNTTTQYDECLVHIKHLDVRDDQHVIEGFTFNWLKVGVFVRVSSSCI